MALQVEDLEDQCKYRQILKIPYDELVTFVLDYIKEEIGPDGFFLVSLHYFSSELLLRSESISAVTFLSEISSFILSLGLIVFPLLCIPVHELLHIIPYYLTVPKK